METIIFDDDLNIFQNTVVLYRDETGKLFIGNTSYYGGRGDGDNYMSIMCKDPLPENMDVMMGWNYLDENSPFITLVPEKNIQTGIEDFLYAHGREKNWRTVEYHIIDDYTEIEPYLKKHPLQKGQVTAFGIKA